MPKNTVDDLNINEFEFVITPDTTYKTNFMHYADYYTGKIIGTSTTLPISNILPGVSPTYVVPEISITGHWSNAGASFKTYVVKTELDTVELLNKYLGYIPRDRPGGVIRQLTCCMYDFYMQVECKSGFLNDTNNVFLFHMHRGFSRHPVLAADNVTVSWRGDSFIISGVGKNFYGVYEKKIFYGLSVEYKAVRTDNIYSDNKWVIEDATQTPPRKFLDIYETISSPVSVKVQINSLCNPAQYGNINSIKDPNLLTPNLNIPGTFVPCVDATSTNVIRSNGSATYNYTDPLNRKIERATYTLNIFAKLNGVDGRVRNSAGAYTYQNTSVTSAANSGYETIRGATFIGNLRQTSNANILIQNKNTVSSAPVSTSTNQAYDKLTYAIVTTATAPIFTLTNFDLRFEISALNGSGYSVLCEDANENTGARFFHVKRVKVVPYIYFYDYIYSQSFTRPGDTAVTSDPIGFRIYGPKPNIETRANFDTAQSYLRLPHTGSNFNILYFYNLKSYVRVFQTNRNNLAPISKVNNSAFNEDRYPSFLSDRVYGSFEPQSNINISGIKKIYATLLARNEIFQNAPYNKFEDIDDSPVYFKGQVLDAFTYNRQPTFDIKKFVVINGAGVKPNPTDPSITFSANAYRFLRLGLRLGPIPGFTATTASIPTRITIFEAQGNKVVERYYQRTLSNLKSTATTNFVFDLMLPDFPGQLVDTQEHPYPRAISGNFSEECENQSYYGVNRIIRIDIHCATKNVNYRINPDNFTAELITATSQPTDILRFNPTNGLDSDLRKLESGSNKFGRRFLLLEHDGKFEEETDIIIENGVKKDLTISEFVNRLNELHPGLDCRLLNDGLATYLQGRHYNYLLTGKSVSNANIPITKFYNRSIATNTIASTNKIIFSEIFTGVYLDFPPFIQDFFNTDVIDSWRNQTFPKRRPENTAYHLDLRCEAHTRGYAYGNHNFVDPSAGFNIASHRINQIYEKLTETSRLIKSESFVVSPSTGQIDVGRGTYRTSIPYGHRLYDYGSNKLNYLTFRISSSFLGSDPILNGPNAESYRNIPIKLLPNKLVRVSFGLVRTYVPNPYITVAPPPPPPPQIYFHISASENYLTNQLTVVLSQSQYSLDPSLTTSINNSLDGTSSVLVYSPVFYQNYNFAATRQGALSPAILGFNMTALNRNLNNDFNTYILSETYRPYDASNSTPQSLIFMNQNHNDGLSWYYYNDPRYEISKFFKRTYNNTYTSSSITNEIFCLGLYNSSIILQSSSLEKVKSFTGTNLGLANDSNYAIFIDGSTAIDSATRTSLWKDLLPSPLSDYSGTYTNPGTVVSFLNEIQFVFYISQQERTKIYFRQIKNKVLSNRTLLIDSSILNSSIIGTLSNLSAKYDPLTNKIGLIFIYTQNNLNNIIYTELDYVNDTISRPSNFHHVAGSESTQFTSSFPQSLIYRESTDNFPITIPYQKMDFVFYNYYNLKGQVGIVYRNGSGEVFLTDIIPFKKTFNKKTLRTT